MLILRRKTGESLILNENIKITVLESGSDGVRLAIDAPKQVQILREELVEATKANQEAVAPVDKEKLEKLKGMLKGKGCGYIGNMHSQKRYAGPARISRPICRLRSRWDFTSHFTRVILLLWISRAVIQ